MFSLFSMAMLAATSLCGAAGIAPAQVTVGESLEVIANLTLEEGAPSGGLEVTLTRADLKISNMFG